MLLEEVSQNYRASSTAVLASSHRLLCGNKECSELSRALYLRGTFPSHNTAFLYVNTTSPTAPQFFSFLCTHGKFPPNVMSVKPFQ